jgi:hypothetical protein
LCLIRNLHVLDLSQIKRSRDSVVGIATGYGLEDRGVGVRVPVRSTIFFSPGRPDRSGAQPLIQWVPGAVSPGLKRQEREADHSPPASAGQENVDLYIHSNIRLHGVVLN